MSNQQRSSHIQIKRDNGVTIHSSYEGGTKQQEMGGGERQKKKGERCYGLFFKILVGLQ